jgi:hypothetical protein
MLEAPWHIQESRSIASTSAQAELSGLRCQAQDAKVSEMQGIQKMIATVPAPCLSTTA